VLPVTATVAISSTTVVALMGVAMVLAILGHMTRIRGLLTSGLLLLFLATFGMLLGGFGAWSTSPGPAPDPLRGDDRQLPPNETVGEARQNRALERDTGQR
jgi:hypothetical protein